jgi:hypothetical protein
MNRFRTALCRLLALPFVLSCAHGPAASTAVRQAASDEVTTVALREAIDRSLRDVRRGIDLEVICVRVQSGDPSAVILTTLAQGVPFAVRPSSSCRIERGESAMFDRAQVLESESGKRGMEIFTESLVFTSATAFTVRVGFFQHAEVSGRWTCAGRQTPSGWRIDRCDDE